MGNTKTIEGAAPMGAYAMFCKLRDQRRHGEEAPEHTEKRAFELAVAGPAQAPAAPVLHIELPDGHSVAFERHGSERAWRMRNAAGQLTGILGPFQAQLVECALQAGMGCGHRAPLSDLRVNENPTCALPAAFSDVLAERRRQVGVEGFTPEHDDVYIAGELPAAAACLASHGLIRYREPDQPPPAWPWSPSWWKPKGQRSNLVRAGALIIAEIERIDRANHKSMPQGVL